MIILILKALDPAVTALLIIAAIVVFFFWRKRNKEKDDSASIVSKIKEFVKNFHSAVAKGFQGEAGYSDKTANILATIIVVLIIAFII